MAVEYGTIAVVPMGEWEAGEQYEVANLVTLDGSSYIAHKRPPVGTQPTDTTYWQVSAQGASKASESSLGVVKSDGVTTNVNDDGVISVKPASQDSPGIVKGSAGITVKEGGSIDVNTTFKQATELANIIAGEAIAQVLGKVSKSIAVTMGLDQNALLKSMLTNIDTNDTNKVPSAALVHTLYERIGMAAELTAGNNLTDAVNQLNSNLGAFKTYTYNTFSPCDDDAMIAQLVAYITDKVQAKAMFIVAGLNLNTYYYTAVGYSGEGGYAAISLNTGINTYVLYVANGAIFYKNKVAMGNVVKDYNNQGLSMFLNQNNGVLTIVCNGSSYDYARI